MTREQLQTLKDFIRALIYEKIEDAAHRDSLHETAKRIALEEKLQQLFHFD